MLGLSLAVPALAHRALAQPPINPTPTPSSTSMFQRTTFFVDPFFA